MANQQLDLELQLASREGAKLDSQKENDMVIDWDGDDDPLNPYNWPAWKTNTNTAFLACLNFVIPLASCELKSVDTTFQHKQADKILHSNLRSGHPSDHGRVRND